MRAYLIIILSAFILVIAYTITQVEAATPQTPTMPFSSAEGRFTVEAPGEPLRTHKAHPSFLGTLHVYTYRVRTLKANYSLAYTDIPKIGVFLPVRKVSCEERRKAF